MQKIFYWGKFIWANSVGKYLKYLWGALIAELSSHLTLNISMLCHTLDCDFVSW